MVAIFFLFPESQYFRNHRDHSPTVEQQNTTCEETDLCIKEEDNNPSISISKIQSVSRPTRHYVNAKKGFLQEIKPWSHIHPDTSYLSFVIRPWPLLVYPAVLYSLFTSSVTLSWCICFVDTHASLFQSPPYNFTPAINSLVYISTTTGVVLGTYFGGSLTDKLAEWMARKNNGIFEPETRLIPLVFPLFITAVGLLMYVTLFTRNLW